MDATVTEPVSRPPARRRRLGVLLFIGVIAILAGFFVRNSTWARERRLKDLSLDELSLAIHDSPNDSLTFEYYAAALMKAGDIPASEMAFERAAELNPRSIRAQTGLGSMRLRRQRLKEAVEAFEKAIKLDPNEATAQLGLAQAYYLAGSPRRAIPPLKQLTMIHPNDAVAWYTLGVMHGNALQWDDAYAALKRAVKLDPNQSDYWRELAQISVHYNKLEDAEKQYARVVKLKPAEPQAYFFMGQLYQRMGDTPKYRGYAEQALLYAIMRDPNMWPAYFELGRLYERRGNYAMAIANYRKVVKLEPGDDKALYQLGLCLIKTGKKEEGSKLVKGAQELQAVRHEIKTLEDRTQSNPNDRSMHLRLARLYRKYGNSEGALREYKRYLQIGPPDPIIAKDVEHYRDELQKAGDLAAAPQTGPTP